MIGKLLLLQFPVIPANAPTTGAPSILLYSGFFVLFAALSILVLLKWLRPSASDKLKYRQHDESEAIVILRAQVEDMKKIQLEQGEKTEKVQLEQGKEIADLRDARESDRKKVQVLVSLCESYYEVMQEIKAEVKELPPHYINRLDRMKNPRDVLKRFDGLEVRN